MTQVLQATIERLKALPNADQEHIASQINDYLTKLEELRKAVQKGLDELDGGLGTPLNMDEIIQRGQERLQEMKKQGG